MLALQEVTGDQPPVIAEACGMSFVFGEAIRGYGNALFARGDIDDVEVLDLPFADGREPRSAILAVVTLPAPTRRLSIAATHLGLHGDAYAQLPVVVRELLTTSGPHVLLGDLNVEDPDVSPLSLTPPRPTFPAERPRLSIDHIATSGLRVVSVDVLGAQPVSDHRPVAVVVEEQQPAG